MFVFRSLGKRERSTASQLINKGKLVLRERIELSTSPLPRECSTTELPQPLMAGLLPYRTGKRKAKNNASVNGFAG
ncbi:hypothetical protein X741_18500 [Mesorhizobium sp. LNHC229A00]|nr:hypothetical protein X741_18500 [Mesorhizobium sp. LNHC229A00]